jgi:hypothetical protein
MSMRTHWPARGKRFVSNAITTLAVLACLAPVLRAQAAHSAQRPQTIRIVGTDYAFAAPDTVNAGPSAFQFVNHGAKGHEIAVVLARPGTTAAKIVATANAGLPTPRLGEAYSDGPALGALFGAPGGSSRATLVTSLERGRVYVIVCTFRDSPTTPQHAALGMFHVIHVR